MLMAKLVERTADIGLETSRAAYKYGRPLPGSREMGGKHRAVDSSRIGTRWRRHLQIGECLVDADHDRRRLTPRLLDLVGEKGALGVRSEMRTEIWSFVAASEVVDARSQAALTICTTGVTPVPPATRPRRCSGTAVPKRGM